MARSVAATAAPAPVVWTSPLPMNSTVALTHRLDPEGRWLMAASRLNTLGPTFTVVDTPRLSRVASWQEQWTPGTTASDITEALRLRADVPTLTGRRVGLTVDNRTRGGQDLYVRLRLVAPGEAPHFAFVGPFRARESSADAAAPYCRSGCAVEAMTIGGL